MIYDLDPPERTGDHEMVRTVAIEIRELFESLEMASFIMTTGSNGYNVVIPLKRDSGFDYVRDFARGVAKVIVDRRSDICTLEQRKEKREGRVFLDTLRNSHGSTAVAPYAVRPLPGAPVAAPLKWSELEEGVDP